MKFLKINKEDKIKKNIHRKIRSLPKKEGDKVKKNLEKEDVQKALDTARKVI